jgi:hypothetical protein
MILTLTRYIDNGVSTIGVLSVDNLSFYTIEDTYRKIKIWGKTRIPSGLYEIKLRTEGSKDDQYSKRFNFHKGMLWLQNVPGFNYILIHIGNTAEDSNGCILVGSSMINNNNIAGSTVAYIRLYKYVIDRILNGEKVYIKIIDNG